MNNKCCNRAFFFKMRFVLIFSIVTILYIQEAHSQYFWNTDFEYEGYNAQPRKWSIDGEGENYYAMLDSNNHQNGNKSLYVKLQKAQVFIFLSLPSQLITGKTVQIEAYVKSLNSDSLQTKFVFLNPKDGRPNASEPNKISTGWGRISYNASFPKNYSSDRLLIALVANGSGSFWLDNVEIVIDGKEYGKGVPDFREPTKDEIKKLNKHAIQIKSLSLTAPNKDLVPLKSMVGKSRIVALGENSHGSAPIYKFKLRVIQYLVKEMGFTVFALESPTVEADKINDYVMGGQGTTNDILRNLAYKSWQTEEMMDIIMWIKSYNETASSKVEFRGFDMQNGILALQAVYDFSLRHDKKLKGEIENVKALYENNKKSDEDWVNLVEHIRLIHEYMSTRSVADYNNLEEAEFSNVNHYIEILAQSISLMNPSERIKNRDQLMADNIEWINQNCGDCKIIISADNDHIRKADGKTGFFLNQTYGEYYLALGMTFNRGTYSAYGPNEFYVVHPSYIGTYEYLFSKCMFDNFYIDLGVINDITLLAKSSGFRVIGSRPQETTQFAEMDLKSNFDIIAYFEFSAHTKYILKY